MKKETINNKKEGGFVILFTILIISVVLAVSLGISSVTSKELILTSSAKEGHLAFFASDTGLDCALHYDRIAALAPFEDSDVGSDIKCFGTTGPSAQLKQINVGEYFFEYNKASGSPSCFSVEVLKKDLPGGDIETRITSRGYNTCDTNSAKRVERKLEATY